MEPEKIIRSITCLLAVDGSIDDRERSFLKTLCKKYGLSPNILHSIFEEIKAGKGRIHFPENQEEKKQLFLLLVQAAAANGEINERERKLLSAVAQKMGFSPSTLDKCIVRVLQKQQSLSETQRKPPPPKAQVGESVERENRNPSQISRLAQNASDSSSSETMTCPSCGFEQRKAQRCSQCGIFIKNYAKRQQKKDESQQETQQSASPLEKSRLLFYAPSGTLSIYSIPVGVFVGLITAAGAGWFYQVIVEWMPLIYLNFLLAIIYGAVIGRAVGLGLQLGKCRNVIVSILLALIIAAIGDALTFRYAYSGMDAIREQVEHGWSVSAFGAPVGFPLKGPSVYVVWIVEFLLICVAAMATAIIAPGEPFCEHCQQWTQKQHLGTISDIDERYLLQALHEEDLTPFLQLPPSSSWKTICYDLYSCPRCRKSRYLKATLEWKDDEEKKQEEVLLDYAYITHEQIAELRKTLRAAKDRYAG